jgi:hypothetical protein
MDLIWKLTPKRANLDYTNLVIKISNGEDINLRDYEVSQVESIIHTFKEEIVDYILKHGLQSLIEPELILEYLVPKGATQNKIVYSLQKYLDKVGIDKELIIIDPYFFAATSDPTYPETIDLTLDKYLTQVDTLHIITYPNKVDMTVKSIIESNLLSKNSSLNIIHKTSNNYHDRFWISNKREKGILTGTSLNGFGKKYFLVGRLKVSDVREIIDSLIISGLL